MVIGAVMLFAFSSLVFALLFNFRRFIAFALLVTISYLLKRKLFKTTFVFVDAFHIFVLR